MGVVSGVQRYLCHACGESFRNARKGICANVEFRPGEIENIPARDGTADVVISNFVINLSSDKERVFQEIKRVLKPGGRIAISDIALKKKLPRGQNWKKLDMLLPLRLQLPVVASFARKGLESFYRTGNVSGIQAVHAAKLRLILSLLDAAHTAEGMRLPSLKLHRLKGARSDIWSVTVQANWRVTFRFENGNAHIVNYEDYH